MRSTSSRRPVGGRALQRASGSQGAPRNRKDVKCLIRVLSIQECAEQSGGYRTTRGVPRAHNVTEQQSGQEGHRAAMSAAGKASSSQQHVEWITPQKSPIEPSWSSSVYERAFLVLRNYCCQPEPLEMVPELSEYFGKVWKQ